MPVSQKTLTKAYQIVDAEDLRTLDAIQLAIAILYSNKIDQLVAADQRLLSAAENNNFDTIDPLS